MSEHAFLDDLPAYALGALAPAERARLEEHLEKGTLKLRGEWELEELSRGARQIVITSIPFAQEKAALVSAIGSLVEERKLAALLDVRDESTKDVRIVCEIKRDADPALVMTYLFRHTSLETTVPVNLTCLVPGANPAVSEPARPGIKSILRHFLDFRFATVKRRFEFDLEELKRRIHILAGFLLIYDALDEAIRIIRKSDGKADAAEKLVKRFDLDDEQADAVLETKLYKLARLEIDAIRAELAEKKAEAAKVEAILKSPAKLWGVVQRELVELRGLLQNEKRKTKVAAAADEPEYDAQAFISAEDTFAILSVDGWLKRQRELKDPRQTRLREGDEVLAVLQGSTKENGVLFSNRGVAYVLRLNDVPPSTGYGEPVQKLFKFGDGERVVSALSLDPRVTPEKDVVLLAATRRGLVLRFSVDPFREETTRAGRRFGKPGENDEIVFVGLAQKGDLVALASEQGRAILFAADEVPVLAGPGKGVLGVKLAHDDRLVGAALFGEDEKRAVLTLVNSKGTEHTITRRHSVVGRGGKGFELIKRDRFVKAIAPDVELVELDGKNGG